MLRHSFLIAYRGLRLHPGYTSLNVLGLSVGIACALTAALYVRGELAYDQFNTEVDRIARVAVEMPDGDVTFTPTAVAPLLERGYPDVEATVRLYDASDYTPPVLRTDAALHAEPAFFYADSTVFDVFTLPLTAGDPETALTRPSTLVLSETAATRYFPSGRALGETVLVDGEPFEVTGVMRDLPPSTHVHFDVLGSFVSLGWAQEEKWDSANFLTYALFRDAAAKGAFPPKLAALMREVQRAGHMPAGSDLTLEPLSTIYLDAGGRRRSLHLFGAVAALILLVSCVNYMNLSTARATQRAKEVGVRKAAGAQRGHLVAQFYGEATLLALAALALGLALVPVLLRVLRAVTGTALGVRPGDPFLVLSALGVVLAVTLVSGSYPAVTLSSFRPAQVLKGHAAGTRAGVRFRAALVAFQIAVTVVLVVGTAVVYRQLRYVQTTDLGFERGEVVAIPRGGGRALPALKRSLLSLPGVLAVSAVDRVPGEQRGVYWLRAEGGRLAEREGFSIGGVPADEDVVEALGLDVIAGTAFPRSDGYVPVAGDYRYIVNEATLREAGWTAEEAVGRRVTVSGDNRWGTVVGVVRDYHYLPLREPVGPLALFVDPAQTSELVVRLAPGDVAGSLAGVEAAWRQFVPDRPFEYRFLDAAFAEAYRADVQLGRLVGAFSLLALFIAVLGLSGLASYAAERRTKEIGIRKAVGATPRDVVVLLSKEFAGVAAVGALVATPVAVFATRRWLEGFAYRAEIGPAVFVLAAGGVVAVALGTVAWQALRAATADPARSLRAE